MCKKGFTLIELLIVVAIIAILAAIAVPNFLEAQVRSKVSRVKADQRTMSIAVEAYHVDNGKYPFGESELWVTNGGKAWTTYPNGFAASYLEAQKKKWSLWTTPVAYMTSVPDDPFAVAGKTTGATQVINYTDKKYMYQNAQDHSITHAVWDTPPAGSWTEQCNQLKAANCLWYIYTYGPSKKQMPDANGAWILGGLTGQVSATTPLKAAYPNIFYDPTNGTTSYGMIFRTNRGVEPAIGKK